MNIRKTVKITSAALLSMFLVSCGQDSPVGYQQPSATIELDVLPLPINITLDIRGRISVEFDFDRYSEGIETPLGMLSFNSGGPSLDVGSVLVNSIKEEYEQQRLLIVRIDEEIEYYEIKKNKKFDINIELDDRLFKSVRISNEDSTSDTIIVELESIPITPAIEEELTERETSPTLSQ